MDVFIESKVNLGSLAFQLAQEVDREDLVEFMKSLDCYVADYDFTLKLRDEFASAIAEEDKHG